MTMSRAMPLRVLVVVEDDDVNRAIEHVLREDGDLYISAASVEEAIRLASADRVDVAFIELRVEGGAALALCHHLPSLSPNVRVQAILHPLELGRGPEALSLGRAAGADAILTGKVEEVSFLGSVVRVRAALDAGAAGQRVSFDTFNTTALRPPAVGETIEFSFATADALLTDA